MRYYVYAIKLDKKVLSSKKFRHANPHLNPKRACYYIGQSSHTPKIRFQQHRKGYKSNHFAQNYGVKLVPRRYRKYNPIATRKQAEYIEQYLTAKLRKKGHGVWSH